jgi:hypothetical protein
VRVIARWATDHVGCGTTKSAYQRRITATDHPTSTACTTLDQSNEIARVTTPVPLYTNAWWPVLTILNP